MSGKPHKKRVPQLKYTQLRNIGWHVSFRDPQTGTPKKHRFQVKSEAEAQQQYHEWVAVFLQGSLPAPPPPPPPPPPPLPQPKSVAPEQGGFLGEVSAEIVQGSLLHVASGLLRFEESRVRPEGERRRKGTITHALYLERRQYTKEFMNFVNSRHGATAVCSLCVADLSMEDIEAYNRKLVKAGYSASQVTKRLRFAKAIIDRAGRPEFGTQTLTWNWDSLDILHGKASQGKALPSLEQLKLVLSDCGKRETAMVWLAIGCGFGQGDLSAIRVNHMDAENYDLRRGKTGIQRFGTTPKLVWESVSSYLELVDREASDLIFLTRQGRPLVHGNSDSVCRWWTRLRKRLGEQCNGLEGFYILRHLGATEFGSRPGCSVGAMRAWLGHSASSQMADVYMKPVSPEKKAVIDWVRHALHSGQADLSDANVKK